jgi:hypothetical protein
MTRGQITSQVQSWLGLQNIAALDETPLIQHAIWRGTIDLLTRTRCVARCVDLHYLAGVDTYTLDHGILSLVDVDNGATRRARRDETGYVSSGYWGTVVYPPGYWDTTEQNPTFTLIRSDVLQIKPVPDADGILDVWAVLRPSQMVDDTNDLSDEDYGAIPEEYQDAIVLYTLWQMADYADNDKARKGELYRQQYEGPDGMSGRIRQIKMLVNKRGTARAPARRVSLSQPGDRWYVTG